MLKLGILIDAAAEVPQRVLEALRQFEAEPSVSNIRAQMQHLSGQAYAYAAPSQLDQPGTQCPHCRFCG
jgi:hypothetical protein